MTLDKGDTMHKHDFLGISDLSKAEIQGILSVAHAMKAPEAHAKALAGKHVLTLFFEPSTRTKMSFDTALNRLGASKSSIQLESSSVKKGETLFDTVQNLSAFGFDGMIVRHAHAGAPHFIAKHVPASIINAGDGFHEHPTQALLDCFTMQEKSGSVEKKNILILGDILHSRVARSNILTLTKLGAQVFVAGPPTLIPSQITEMGVTIIPNLDAAIPHMDIINCLRIQYERQDLGYFPSIREYRQHFGLTAKRLAQAKPSLTILHPGPMNRGIEIDSEVADGPQNVILDQVKNGVFVRMAILLKTLHPAYFAALETQI
jgi:aspartate carbamoyltransferase catalytic subunit